MKDHTFTLGIEEEFAIIDPETREPRSHIHEILEGGKITLKEQIKPEMHQSLSWAPKFAIPLVVRAITSPHCVRN